MNVMFMNVEHMSHPIIFMGKKEQKRKQIDESEHFYFILFQIDGENEERKRRFHC